MLKAKTGSWVMVRSYGSAHRIVFSSGVRRNREPEVSALVCGDVPTEEGAMADDHGPQIKDDERYEALRKQGASKEKAARIANTGRRRAAKRGGRSPVYEDWNKDDLYQRAKEIGIAGRSDMSKGELIDAIRNH
jgi:hypothetical protein